MGYSPTEYAEFTEPPAEKSLPRISQICTDVRVRCSPTEFTEFTEPPTEMSSHGFHRFTQILRVRCSPTEFGSVGMAGMPYPPTSVNIRAVCGRLFSARGSVSSVRSVGASSPLVLLVQQRLLHPLAESTEVVCTSHHLTISPQQHHFTSNPAFCMSSQYCGYDFVTTCGSLMRSPGNTMAAGANAIAMRWSS